ncbi:MAG: hypothetical protein HYV53_05200 [Parcubacteria group bacterium]|nr:hypothetical protein [Parcubacteria group bacterium]
MQETQGLPREELIRKLFSEAADRVVQGEEPDPCTAIVGALLRREAVEDAELQLVLDAHCGGPWQVNTTEKLEIFSKWCEAAGSSLEFSSETEAVNGQTVYRGDYGDCCLVEASKGNRWAVWTRKGRLQIGFREEADAKAFRSADARFSMEALGNKRIALVVIEGGDTPEMINAATAILNGLAA